MPKQIDYEMVYPDEFSEIVINLLAESIRQGRSNLLILRPGQQKDFYVKTLWEEVRFQHQQLDVHPMARQLYFPHQRRDPALTVAEPGDRSIIGLRVNGLCLIDDAAYAYKHPKMATLQDWNTFWRSTIAPVVIPDGRLILLTEW